MRDLAGNPKACADSLNRWIGLRSPDAAAYRRPRFALRSHTAVGAKPGSGRRSAWDDGVPDERLSSVVVSVQTTSSSTLTELRISKTVPLGCGRSGPLCTVIANSACIGSGLSWVIVLLRWTMPIGLYGNDGSDIRSRCSGNARTCGYVTGSAGPAENPVTSRYAVRWSWSTVARGNSRVSPSRSGSYSALRSVALTVRA